MKRPRKLAFNLFMYQIVPISEHVQLSLPLDNQSTITSLEDLLLIKNKIFINSLISVVQSNNYDERFNIEIEDLGKDLYVVKYGFRRHIKHITKEFQEKNVESWPYIYIIIDNNDDKQNIAIQIDRSVVRNTSTISRYIQKLLNDALRVYNLAVYIRPRVRVGDFWYLVQKHKGKIKKVQFELITPNLADLSGKLDEGLKNFFKATKSNENKVVMEAGEGGSLSFSHDDPNIVGIVEYAMKGGGGVKLGFKGYKEMVDLKRKVVTREIDEVSITSMGPEGLSERISGEEEAA